MTSIFTKILKGEIPGDIIFQDERFFVIKDINPVDKTHLLIIPKEEFESINNITDINVDIISNLFLCGIGLVKKFNLTGGYELKMNAGDKQEIPHIHMHLISNRQIR